MEKIVIMGRKGEGRIRTKGGTGWALAENNWVELFLDVLA